MKIIFQFFFLIFFFVPIFLNIFLCYFRTEWYSNFYNLIVEKQDIIFCIPKYALIVVFIIFNNFFKDILKLKFIKHEVKKWFFQISKIKIQKIDISQRISEDIEHGAKNFINFIDDFFSGLLSVIFFSYIFIQKINFNIFLYFASYLFLILILNFTYIRKKTKKVLNIFENDWGVLRKFLSQIFASNAISSLPVKNLFFIKVINSMSSYYIFKSLLSKIKEIFDYIASVTPFIIFYSFYKENNINYGEYMQLISICTLINFNFLNFFNALQYLFESEVNFSRFISLFQKKNIIFQKEIFIYNLTVKFDNKTLFEKFNLNLKMNQKINIVGPSGSGKTTIFNKIKDYYFFPQEIIFIPEQAVIPENFNFKDFSEHKKNFDNYLKIFNIQNLNLKTMSAGEKWKLIASYSLCFDFIIWDDPFWAVDAAQEIAKIYPYFKTCLIFSQTPIKGFHHIYL